MAVFWCLLFPLCFKAVLIWFEPDLVPRTSTLLPVYPPVLAPCERVCLPTRAGVIGKDDEGGLKESCTP